MKTYPVLSRRKFIDLLLWLAGLLGLGGLLRYFSYKPLADQSSRFELGAVGNFPPGSRTVRIEIPAVIYNQDGEISAYRLVCTHLGCRVAESGSDLKCPCHGSVFDHNGKVIKGPAKKPLQALEVEISPEGQLILKVQK